MANDLSGLITPILAKGLMALRTTAIAPRLVNISYSNEVVKRGNTIQIPAYQNATTYDVAPSNVLVNPADTNVGMVNLTLDKWVYSALKLTDQDLWAIENGAESPAINACIIALSEAVHADIISKYKLVYGVVGTAGTTPFGSASLTDATLMSKQLTVQKAPQSGRQVLIEPTSAAAAKMIPAFHNQQFSSTSDVLMEGQLGKHFGMNWYEVNTVPIHTAGGGSGYLVNGAAVTAGLSTIPVDTGTGTLVKGDIITFAGHTQTYAITADYAGGTGNITITPSLRVNVADNVAITKMASATVNLAFCRDAIAFASRPEPTSLVPNVIMRSVMDDDPVYGSGLALTLEMQRQNKQDAIVLSLQWGCVLARPEYAIRLLA